MLINKKNIFFGVVLWAACTGAVAETLSVEKAERLMQTGRFAEAVTAYRALLEAAPESVDLRLKYADALTRDRDWDMALAEYQEVLKRDANNGEAKRSMGSLLRWRGDIEGSKEIYLRALQQNPHDLSAQLGLASTYRQDHDYANADRVYQEAAQLFPDNKNIEHDLSAYQQEKTPRIHVLYQEGITSKNYLGGVMVPFANREELGVLSEREIRPDIYSRTDTNFLYSHFFGFRHALDFRYRHADFSYDIPVSSYAAIDTFDEYRIRYTFTVQHNNVVRVRYTWRPTSLKNSGDDFDSHKLEAEVRTYWNARFNTTLGGGWLRDLPEEASRASDLKNNDLVNLGIEYLPDNDWGFSARYITNPDLDNSINSTQILQVDYRINGTYSLLARYKVDDYKTSGDEIGYFAGLRFVPNHHLWSELGMKYATRDGKDGTYPFLSLVWRL